MNLRTVLCNIPRSVGAAFNARTFIVLLTTAVILPETEHIDYWCLRSRLRTYHQAEQKRQCYTLASELPFEESVIKADKAPIVMAQTLSNLVLITRASFLPLTVVIVSAGLAAALYAHGVFNPYDALVVLIGALLTHAAVNVFNNYFDYRSGIDAATTKTPFSGGVDILVEGKMRPSTAFAIGLVCLFGAILIGVYFLARVFYPLLPILLYGVVAICLYTPVLSRVHAISEIVAGTGFGLMGLGAYVTQTRMIDGTGIAVFVPVAILVGLLLFLNEFPDAEADREAGRRHLAILLGRKRSAWLYVVGLIATYASIILAVATAVAPLPILIAFLTVPIAYKAGRIAIENYDQIPRLVPALASNVMLILLTILLITLGFLIGLYA